MPHGPTRPAVSHARQASWRPQAAAIRRALNPKIPADVPRFSAAERFKASNGAAFGHRARREKMPGAS
ncbi:MAG: hypothetical protein GAK45_00977 [Pseudomonas citronellolis]|nr:MAG: hypothetical protein GAK45_00977 [Pseudomonas citronellolis]